MTRDIILTLPFLLSFLLPSALQAKFQAIRNDVFWNCADGSPLYSQGGGIFRFDDPNTGRPRYFWYGMHYREADMYRSDPSVTHDRCTFQSVTCHVSDDLVHWSFRGDVLTRDEVYGNIAPTWVGRMGVAKVDSVYAIFIQCGAGVLVAESKSPTGEFRWARHLDMTKLIGTAGTGDQTVFTDEDTGKSYLICSKGSGRNKIFVAEIGRTADGNIGLVDCTEVYSGDGREGNCMFKRGGKYYLCASNLYGWDSSYAYFLVADNVKGPYRKAIPDYQRPENEFPKTSRNANQMMQVMPGCEKDYAHITQTGFFYTVKKPNLDNRNSTINNPETPTDELVLYCGDRWSNFAGNGLGYNQWVPLSFDGDIPVFNSLSAWSLDTERAVWKVDRGNNYVMNGSFEADRRIIPLAEKPRQDYILGWDIEYIKGNKASLDNPASPRLNYEKSRQDRRESIGEKALLITDSIDFARRVNQVISPTGAVSLPDGIYTLTAKIRTEGTFKKLQLFCESAGKTKRANLPMSIGLWSKVTLDGIRVKNGKATIGIYAEGRPNALCLVDDVDFRLADQ